MKLKIVYFFASTLALTGLCGAAEITPETLLSIIAIQQNKIIELENSLQKAKETVQRIDESLKKLDARVKPLEEAASTYVTQTDYKSDKSTWVSSTALTKIMDDARAYTDSRASGLRSEFREMNGFARSEALRWVKDLANRMERCYIRIGHSDANRNYMERTGGYATAGTGFLLSFKLVGEVNGDDQLFYQFYCPP